MTEIQIKAFGKVNLGLDVTGRREDGYHLVRMIMQTVNVYDVVSVEKLPAGSMAGQILLTCDVPEIPTDRSNLAVKAAGLIAEHFGLSPDLKIHIEKRIPMAAGMAGGSADAAAVITAMDQLFNLKMGQEQMDRFALKLGADVPFCLRRGTWLAEGIGEKLTKLNDLPSCYMVIVKPPFGVSTPWAYKALDEYIRMHPEEQEFLHPDIDRQIKGLCNGDIKETADAAGNILEKVVEIQYPQIREIRNLLYAFGAVKAMMSGSGPTVFGVFTEKEKAAVAMKNLGGQGYGKFEVEF